MSALAIVPVLLPLPLDAPFDYRLPEGCPPPPPGSFVIAPVGSRRLVGVVWDWAAATSVAAERLKTLEPIAGAPALPSTLQRLIDAVAAATVTPRGAVLRMAMPPRGALEPWPQRLLYRRGGAEPQRASGAWSRTAAALAVGAELPASELAAAARISPARLRELAARGLLAARLEEEPHLPPCPDLDRAGPSLSPAQAVAYERLAELVRHGDGTALLDGVPGSGKTEVYLEAIAATLRRGRRALVLLPEIALSAQWLARFAARFGAEPVVWHSALTTVQRRRAWRAVAEGRAPVVVGARSALFLPLSGLGLIVVDEEHDGSFKQEDGVIYHARDMALVRARLEGCPVVLASATPALETALAAGALDGAAGCQPGWLHLQLPARHAGAAPPAVELVDLRRTRPPKGAFLAAPLRAAVGAALERGEQALLFLNRRGYAPLTLCRACGHRFRCPNCSAWLTAHRFRGRLICHHCGYGMPAPDHCAGCGAVDSLAASGPGVERIVEEVAALWPQARLALVTSDSITSARAVAELLDAVLARRIDLLVGTQILAKGHHFPALTVVGVVDADLSLGGGDPRAAERTFQLLYQAAGRAGRAERTGRVLIQTHLPEHPVMQALAAGDRDRFLAAELAERIAGKLPPIGRLAALIFTGRDMQAVKAAARGAVRAAGTPPAFRILGPAPAPLALLRGRWRERVLVQCGADADLAGFLRGWCGGLRLPAQVSLQIDVDPISFL